MKKEVFYTLTMCAMLIVTACGGSINTSESASESTSDKEMVYATYKEAIAANDFEAAYKIIEAKRATYYGIGMAMTRITQAVFGNENSVLTVSAKLNGEYGQKDVFIGVPAVVNRNGIRDVVRLPLSKAELNKFSDSCDKLHSLYDELKL